MTPLPVPLSLILCEKVIVEVGSMNTTLVSTFTKLTVDAFPSPPQRFALYVVLTDGRGDGTIEALVTRQQTDEVVYEHQLPVHFPTPLAELRVVFRINRCVFPAPGRYQVTLLMDGEWLTERLLEVAERQDPP